MTKTNQVYNSHFLLDKGNNSDFPDGWARIGGNTETKWEWMGTPDGPRAVKIVHPSGNGAGIILKNDVLIPAGERQRWEIRVVLQTEPVGVPCYIRVYLGAVSQQLFSLQPSLEPEVFNGILATPAGVTGIRIEVGILGEGIIIIHEIQGWRLYPQRELRLDEKGQVYVRHIESIGKIQSPVPVMIKSPLPLPVDVRTPITVDLRDLTPSQDALRIFASNGQQINATSDGVLQVILSGRKYLQSSETVIASDVYQATKAKDVSEVSIYSVAVYNIGTVSATVQLQISPDGAIWIEDGSKQQILPEDLKVVTPNHFLRYVRLIYRAQISNPLQIWFQAQS